MTLGKMSKLRNMYVKRPFILIQSGDMVVKPIVIIRSVVRPSVTAPSTITLFNRHIPMLFIFFGSNSRHDVIS
jgi:hypothetical protein